jgi:hypothetical protein
MSKSRKKDWGDMTAAELAEATKEFDRPLPASRFRPMTKAEREQFERVRRAGGPGAHRINALELDARLLKQARAYAKRKNLTLTQLLERGLRRELAVTD